MKAHIAYLNYVLRHKWFVFLAGLKTKAPIWRLLIHDWTKFLPCEWSAYVRSFYNPDGSRRDWKTRAAWEVEYFDWAWNHHQKTNDHHWQHWVLITDSDEPRTRALRMPNRCVLEMVADWVGAGRAITGRVEVVSWYAKNADKMLLHPETREAVCRTLRQFMGKPDGTK